MQNKLNFDIERKSNIDDSFRVQKIIGQFDLKKRTF